MCIYLTSFVFYKNSHALGHEEKSLAPFCNCSTNVSFQEYDPGILVMERNIYFTSEVF